ncbi:hypothetical protein [Pseudoduganella sp.]|uniref:hypothetical protein n=1 Tax=Pseudoduganella sp. TaxID=1880898 RepID=UPI0035B06409
MASNITDKEIITLLSRSNQLLGPPMGISSRLPNEIAVYLTPPDLNKPAQQKLFKDAQYAIIAINDKIAVELTRTNDEEDADICITYGTAFVKPGRTDYQNFAGNVTWRDKGGDEIEADGAGGIQPRPVRIQLGHERHGDRDCDCLINRETIIHEFGHALGLGQHFKGFDGRVAISGAFWDVLATLYANPPGTPFAQLKVHRVG